MMSIFSSLFKLSRKEIAYLFAKGRPFCRIHSLKVIKAPLLGDYPPDAVQTKLLIITPRRIGKAHERNLLRRRIKEIVYSNKLYEKQHGLFGLITYPGVTRRTYKELESFLISCFSQAL